MLKKIFDFIPATTIIVLFLFICGTLYLITFWGEFDIDISNLVGIWEIPKSFVMPFVYAFGILIFPFVISSLVTPSPFVKDENKLEEDKKRERPFIIKLLLNINLWLLIISIPVVFLFWLKTFNPFLLFPTFVVFAILLFLKFYNSNFMKKLIQHKKIRLLICGLFVLTPIFCVGTAKLFAMNIYHNKNIKLVKIRNSSIEFQNKPVPDSPSLKLVGFLGDKIIISTIDNSKVLIINQSSFQGVELIDTTIKK